MKAEELLERLSPYVTALSKEFGWGEWPAEDLFQEGMVALLEISFRYRGTKDENLVKIGAVAVQHRFINLSRRRRKYREILDRMVLYASHIQT